MSLKTFCLVMGQINTEVGDVSGNVRKIIRTAVSARDEFQADLIIFPELTVTGYPPEDLLLRPGLMRRVNNALAQLQSDIDGIAVVVGHPAEASNGQLYNAISFIAEHKILATYFKRRLPNYGVFDEKRYFIEGNESQVVDFKGVKFGLSICEDIWFEKPSKELKQQGADVILSLNASPFTQTKSAERDYQVQQRTSETGLPVIYVNQVGGQDELVFDGGSLAIDHVGDKVAQAKYWSEQLLPIYLQKSSGKPIELSAEKYQKPNDLAMTYQGLVMGIKDYVEKNHFPGVIVGLSGGIDSALTLALAVDALGAAKVKTIMMPSQYTAQMSLDDAEQMASGLGVHHSVIKIDAVFTQFQHDLAHQFEGHANDTTEENIQARCRGVMLMALSNKFGSMVLTTGNKSEVAVGYSTLYGDMAGGFSPLKDVYKTLVYKLSEYRNTVSLVIPERIITRLPSAELAPEQFDQDSLPPYDVLDEILQCYIENDLDFDDIVKQNYDADVVEKVIKLVDRNEYKRRQAAPGIRITSRAFGRERRYPITSAYTIN
jgi:NAD+ synthase (glutamine-hydrolysing)